MLQEFPNTTDMDATEPVEYRDYHNVLFSLDSQELVVASTEDVEIKFWDLATT